MRFFDSVGVKWQESQLPRLGRLGSDMAGQNTFFSFFSFRFLARNAWTVDSESLALQLKLLNGHYWYRRGSPTAQAVNQSQFFGQNRIFFSFFLILRCYIWQ